jgi:26S proteasome regulatory subunit (ATPase 3-interacting protein)
VHALETEEAAILARLDGLKKGKAKKITESEREAIEKEWKKSGSVAKKREKIAVEMWKIIADLLPDKEAQEEHREMFDLDG